MKSKIKLTEEFIKKSGISLDIKDIPEDSRYIKRISTDIRDVILSEDEATDEMTCNGWISTIDIDSDGEIVLPEGLKMDRFLKNPVVNYNHNIDSLPVGRCEAISVHPEGILAKTKFASIAFAKNIYKLVKEKCLNTFSIGFIPLKSVAFGSEEFANIVKALQIKSPDRFKDISKLKRIITEGLLYEYSVVNVPANQEALVLAVKSMDKDTQDIILFNKSIKLNLTYNILPKGVQIKEDINIIKREYTIIGHDYSDKIQKIISGKLS